MFTVKSVLFDMDGVLVKSEETWFQVVTRAGEKFRGRAISREEFFPTFGQGTAADVGVFGLECSVKQLDAFYADHFAQFGEHLWINPDAAPLLEQLRSGGFSLAVVTNTVTRLAQEILAIANLQGHFDAICCADEVARAKPAPDLVQLAGARLGVELRDTVMVGDSRFDRVAAGEAGAGFIGFGIDGDFRVERLTEVGGLVRKP